MLIQLLRQLAAFKIAQLEAQHERNQQQIDEIDRQIAANQAEIDRLKAEQKALFRDFN